MIRLLAAPFAAIVLVTAGMSSATALSGKAMADTAPPPPFIDHAEWAHWGDLSSLRVYPTPAGRQASSHLLDTALSDEAWSEVLALAPDAAIEGMREQFICHWNFAEVGQPGKTSWNLEPWRPVVDNSAMVDAGCNPGGTEEPF